MNTQMVLQWLPTYLVPFVTLSYPVATPAAPDSFPNSSYYGVGLLDGCLIITCIAVMAILRDFTRLYISEPFACWKLTRDLNKTKRAKAADVQQAQSTGHGNDDRTKGEYANGHSNGQLNGNANGALAVNGNGKANGLANGNGHVAHPTKFVTSRIESRKIRRSVIRFAEQGWSFVYYTTLFIFGSYVHHNVPTKVLNPTNLWLLYPNMPLAAPIKFYYLLETAFYLHQVLILNAEARRKDHWQMMTHHIITVILMIGSYYNGFTRIGCLIMLLMDCCDIFLPLAKMFRYLSMTTLCDATFTFFLLSWLVTRHILFILAIQSTIENRHHALGRLRLDREHPKMIYYTFTTMLIMLQFIQLMWFWMICRIAYRVVSGKGAADTRSDDEGDDEPAEESKKDR